MSDIVDRLKTSVAYIEKWYADIDMIARVDVSLRVNKELMAEAAKEIEELREVYGKCITCSNHGNDGKMVTMCLPCYEKLHSEVMRLRYEQERDLTDVDRFRKMAQVFEGTPKWCPLKKEIPQ
jgi:hypothetical protein